MEGGQALFVGVIRRWIANFKDGKTQVDGKPRSGHPREVVTPENTAKVEELVTNGPHVTARRLEDEISISHERIDHLIHSKLGLHKGKNNW